MLKPPLITPHRPLHREQLTHLRALVITALICFLLANLFPIAVLDLYGRQTQANLVQAVWVLFAKGSWFIGAVVLGTAIVLPLLEILALLYLTWPNPHVYRPHLPHAYLSPMQQKILRMLPWFRPWSMIEVFLLGVLVSIVKLKGFAAVLPGPALWALIVLLLLVAASFYQLKKSLHLGLIQLYSRPQTRVTAHANLKTCWAFLLAAAAFYIPANSLPVMETRSSYAHSDDTIYSGVVYLWESGSWHLAVVIFFASIVIPLFKIVALAFLLLSVQLNWLRWRIEQRWLYRIVEVIGRWSMLDIFVATMLATLVQLQGLGRIEVAAGAGAFAAVVILTMLAAQSFDPRWLLRMQQQHKLRKKNRVWKKSTLTPQR